MPTVEVAGVGEIEFPDSMTDDEILKVLQRDFPSRKAPQLPAATEQPVEQSLPETIPGLSEATAPAPQRVIQAEPIPEPTDGPGLITRFLNSTASNSLTALRGASRAADFTPGTLLVQGVHNLFGSKNGPQQFNESMREGARQIQEDTVKPYYNVPPATTLPQKVAEGLGSLPAVIASGPLAPATAGAMMGESQMDEAKAAGASPTRQALAFAGGAATGVVSEALLGLPALLRSAKAAGANPSRLKAIVYETLKGSVREGSQESIEQIAGNLTAKALYDNSREWNEGVQDAAIVGAIIGGGLGGTLQLQGQQQTPEASQQDETDQRIMELRGRGVHPVDIARELNLPEEEVIQRGLRFIEQESEERLRNGTVDVIQNPARQNQPVENTGQPDLSKFGSAVRPQPEPEVQVDPETGVALTPSGPVRVTPEGDVPLAPVEQASLRSLGRDVSPTPQNEPSQPQQEPQTPIQPAPAPQQPGQPTDTQGDATAAAQTAVLEDGSAVQPVGPQPSMAPEVEVAEEPATPAQQQPAAAPENYASELVPQGFVQPQRSRDRGDVVVTVWVPEADRAFQRDQEFYIGQNEEGVQGRRRNFEEFLERGSYDPRTGEYAQVPVEMPEADVGTDGTLSFLNGRHRFAFLRDRGVTEIPVAMSPESAEQARRMGLTTDSQATAQQPTQQAQAAPVAEATPAPQTFPEQVMQAALRVPAEQRVGRKVLFEDVWNQFRQDTGSDISLDDFKRQLLENRRNLPVIGVDFVMGEEGNRKRINSQIEYMQGHFFNALNVPEGATASAPVSTPSEPAEEPAVPVQEPPTPPEEPPAPPAGTAQPAGSPENVTGLRRALVDEDMVRAGMATLPDFKKETFQGYIDAANTRLGKEAKAAEKLVDSLVGNPRPLVTAEESGLLLHEYATRKKELANARTAALNSTPENRDYANARFKEAQQKFQEAYEVARYVGHERGVSLASQKLLVDDQFELTTMEADVRVRDNNGEALSEKQMREISEYHAEIQRLREEIQRYQDREAQMAAEATVENIAEEEGAANKPDSKKESRVIKYLDAKADAARKSLREKLNKFGSSPDPTIVWDAAVVGATYIARGVRTLASFTARLVQEFGEGIRGLAPQIYEAAKTEYENAKRDAGKPTPDEVIQDVEPKEGLNREIVAGVVRAHLRNGVTGSGPVLQATLDTLKSKFPDITLSDVYQELSQYGKVKYPSRDSIESEIRRLTTISRLQKQLEDVLNKQPPKKTGYQRDPSDPEIRELQKQISDLMRANGIQSTDPATQLASSLQAAKRRMQNEIEEIERAIAANQRRPANQRTIQYDEEARQLQQRLADARARYNEAFPREPISEEEQVRRAVKVVERAIAEEERMLREGILKRPPNAQGPTSPELENRQMELAALRQLRNELWQAENPGKTPEQRALDAALAAARKSIARMDEMFRTGNLTPQQRQQKFNSTDELDALRSERDAMATAIRELRMAERPKTSQEERTIKALEKSIAAIDQKLQSGDLSPAARQVNRPETQRITELREIRDDLNKKLQEARKDARPPTSDEVKEQRRVKRELKALDKQIEELNRRVAAKDLSLRNRVQNRPEVKELAERRELRDSLRESLDELRKAQKPAKDPDKARLDANKKAVQKRTKDLQEKLRKKDYSKPTRKQIEADNELKKLRYDYDKLTEQWHRERFEAEMKHWRWDKKFGNILLNAAGMMRILKLGIDFGTVLRQGIQQAFSRPNMVFGRAIPSMFKAFASEQNQHAIMQELQKLDGYKSGLWKRTKLAVIDPSEYRLNKMEEEFASRWVSKLPGIKRFERATVTFLNVVRAYAFESLVAASDTTGKVDENRAQVLANFVNATTGRGNLGRLETWAAPAATIALAPRFYVSRFQAFTGHSFLWKTGGKSDWVTRKIIAKEYGRMILGRGVYMALWAMAALMAGEELKDIFEENMASTDFGKIKWGSTRIDASGGTIPFIVFMARMVSGRTKTSDGDIRKLYGEDAGPTDQDTDKVIRSFIESRRSPTLAFIHDLMRREHYGDKQMTVLTILEEIAMPLTVADAYNYFRNHSPAKAAVLTGAAIFGESIQDYQPDHSIIYDTLNSMGAGLEEPKTSFDRKREKDSAPQTPAQIRRQLRKELGVPSAKQLRKEIMGE